MALTTEKEHLMDQVATLQKQNNRFRNELDDRRIDSEKLKALQSHSSHQQMLLNQLKNRLEEHE
jgi:hypothetical protein